MTQLKFYVDAPNQNYANHPCQLTRIFVCDDSACAGETTLGTCGPWSGAKGNYTCDITDTTGQWIRLHFGTWYTSCVTDRAIVELFDTYYLQGASDTCTPPEAGDYSVNAADNCDWVDADDIPGNVYISGAGVVTLSAKWTFTGSNQKLSVANGASLVIVSGGSIN